MMKSNATLKLTLSGLFLALGLALPFLTGQIPEIGSRLLPMHIPVLLCGFICGPRLGLAVGFLTPLLRSFIFTMPVLFPMATTMAFELAAYGFVAGFLYQVFPRKKIFVYISLILSMLAGRIIWGAANYVLLGFGKTIFTWQIFAAGAFFNAIPGIIIQLLIIPVIVLAVERHTGKSYGTY